MAVPTRGKSINLFLMDGMASGRIKCTLANWTGVAYKIPRTELEKCNERDDLKQSGVDFLFGIHDRTGENIAYIGQAGARKNGEGILFRLREHKRNPEKNYWTEAVVFTTSNNSFGPTEISYLENRFCNLALDTKRYIIKNGNDPTSGHITEEKEIELEEFIDYAKIVMGTLGYKLFEPLQALVNFDNDEQCFYISRNGTNAKGQLTNEGFVVFAGSVIRKKLLPSCPDYIKTMREDNKENINDKNVLLKNCLFKTPSGAAAFIIGGAANGYIEWKAKNGKALKDIESKEIDE